MLTISPVATFNPSTSWPVGYSQLYGKPPIQTDNSFALRRFGDNRASEQTQREKRKTGSGEADGHSLPITQQPHKTAWDTLAKTSLGAMLLVNSAMLFSPLIAKGLKQWATPAHLEQVSQKVSPKVASWLNKNADYDTLKTSLVSLNSVTALMQLNTGYQVGINTQQPSKSLSSFIGTLTQLASVFKPHIPYIQTISYLTSFFWFSGETNDIRNNNTPGQRRELDQRRLWQAFKGQQTKGEPGFFRECWNALKFMGKDFSYTLSSAPWNNLKKSLHDKKDFKKPQPYQTAIGAQLNFIGFITATMAFIAQVREKARAKKEESLVLEFAKFTKWPEKYKKLPMPFVHLTKGVLVFSIISYLPVLMRALQSKGEADGALTFIGVPMITASQVIKGTLDIKNFQGLLNMGSPIVNEGKRINSKKYRAQVNYLKALHEQAQKNPALKAQDILSYLESHPDELKNMSLSMGEFRVNYILDLLRTGATRQQTQNISFASYLVPLMKMGA